MSLTADTIAASEQQRQKFKRTVAESVALMDAVLLKMSDTDVNFENLDDAIAEYTNEDDLYINASSSDDDSSSLNDGDAFEKETALRPAVVAERLQTLLEIRLPSYIECFERFTGENARPSRAIRYWPVAATLLVCHLDLQENILSRYNDNETANPLLSFHPAPFFAYSSIERSASLPGSESLEPLPSISGTTGLLRRCRMSSKQSDMTREANFLFSASKVLRVIGQV